MKNFAPRWKVLLHAVRIFRDYVCNDTIVEFDDKKLSFTENWVSGNLTVIDAESGELLLEYEEDGSPIFYSNDWMQMPMNHDVPTDYPMCDTK